MKQAKALTKRADKQLIALLCKVYRAGYDDGICYGSTDCEPEMDKNYIRIRDKQIALLMLAALEAA